jgi:transposase InsO family protein
MNLDLGKTRMVERYGEIREGTGAIIVRGVEFRPRRILARWMMDVPEVWSLDGGALGDDRYWIRFLDADDRCIVVFEDRKSVV